MAVSPLNELKTNYNSAGPVIGQADVDPHLTQIRQSLPEDSISNDIPRSNPSLSNSRQLPSLRQRQ